VHAPGAGISLAGREMALVQPDGGQGQCFHGHAGGCFPD
jgi:hypothetical protein